MTAETTTGDGPFTGGCLRGAVRFETVDRPQGRHFCHCRTCQKAVAPS